MTLIYSDILHDDSGFIKHLFPNIDWNKTRFEMKLPWFMQNSFATAAVLPSGYFNKKLSIHFRSNTRLVSFLETLYHELIHVQQYQNLDKKLPIGLGFFRCFMIHYIAWTIALFIKGIAKKKLSIKKALRFAYFENPFEKEAYDKTRVFYSLISSKGIPENILAFSQEHPKVVLYKSEYNKTPPIWTIILSTLFCFIIFVFIPLLDFFAYCISKVKIALKK